MSRASTERFNETTVCLSVRVSHEEAEAVRAWAALHRVSIQQVLRQCVTSATCVLADVGRRAMLVTSHDAALGSAATHPLRLAAERAVGA